MDRYECINALIETGMGWYEAVCLFHDKLARLENDERRAWFTSWLTK